MTNTAESDAPRCVHNICVCCICSLRGSRFGSAITDADPCCTACHAEVAEPDWPGYRCGTPDRVIPPGSDPS